MTRSDTIIKFTSWWHHVSITWVSLFLGGFHFVYTLSFPDLSSTTFQVRFQMQVSNIATGYQKAEFKRKNSKFWQKVKIFTSPPYSVQISESLPSLPPSLLAIWAHLINWIFFQFALFSIIDQSCKKWPKVTIDVTNCQSRHIWSQIICEHKEKWK